jgi:hypothetical protein
MKIFHALAVLFSVFLLCACSPQAEVEVEVEAPEASAESQFDGVWEFVHLVTPDGEMTTQRGHMVVNADHVCFVRVGQEREAIANDDSDEVKAEKAAGLYNGLKATCGSYAVEGERMTATWLTSADPSVEGNVSEFVLVADGDTVSLAPAAATQFKFVYRRVQ